MFKTMRNFIRNIGGNYNLEEDTPRETGNPSLFPIEYKSAIPSIHSCPNHVVLAVDIYMLVVAYKKYAFISQIYHELAIPTSGLISDFNLSRYVLSTKDNQMKIRASYFVVFDENGWENGLDEFLNFVKKNQYLFMHKIISVKVTPITDSKGKAVLVQLVYHRERSRRINQLALL